MRIICAVLLSLVTPAPTATPSIFVAQIPFTDCHNAICVPVSVGGKGPFNFLFDTSDARSAVDSASATGMGLHLDPYVGRSGKVVPGIFKTTLPTVSIGNIAESSVDAVAVDFNSGMKGTGVRLDGSIAYPYFKDRVVQIDYPAHIIRISGPIVATWACAFHCNAMKLITFGEHGPPIITSTFTINGKAVTAQIDTTYEGAMLIYPHAVDALGLAATARHTTPRFFPITDGGVTMLGATARMMGFAGLPLGGPHPTVYFATKGVHVPDGMFEATVGNELFRGHVVTLDFHDMVMSVN